MTRVLDVVNPQNEKVDEVVLSEAVFGVPVKGHLLHEAVRWQRARQRRGTASTKGRSEVSGGGRKPWRQKGTGRARAGSNRSPLWRHGGISHGPKPRDWSFRFPKALRRDALRTALSTKIAAREVRILEDLTMDRPSTKTFQSLLKGLGITGKVLVVTSQREEAVEKSARNLPRVKVLLAQGVNVSDVLNADAILFTREALVKVEEALTP
ncbi:MAG: 50S ribosomal protein L4 [candidate division NC10 bacterium]|jgi:large subunit ribosomal protein L4|nr:50S ribosomal protein L4 [candidate division NC10 bacterium]